MRPPSFEAWFGMNLMGNCTANGHDLRFFDPLTPIRFLKNPSSADVNGEQKSVAAIFAWSKTALDVLVL